MHRSVELHLHRGGPFVLAMCATLVYLAASLWVPRLVFDLLSSLHSLILFLSLSGLRSSFPPSASLFSFLRVPREHSKNWRRVLSSRNTATNNAPPRWSAARRDLNLDNLTCTNPSRGYLRHTSCVHTLNRTPSVLEPPLPSG